MLNPSPQSHRCSHTSWLFLLSCREDVLGRVGFLHLARNKLSEAMRLRRFSLNVDGVEALQGVKKWNRLEDGALHDDGFVGEEV